MILAPRRVPTWAPNGPNIASKIIIGLEIYRNRLGEGSERAREAKKVVWELLGAILGLRGADDTKKLPNCPSGPTPRRPL